MQTTPSSEMRGPAAEPVVGTSSTPFVDRRKEHGAAREGERRQFASSHHGLSPDARELALAIDSYKLEHRRRYVTYEEMLQVINALGYHR